jgi:predicted nucleotidyltransferase
MDLREPASALAPGLTIPLLRALASRGSAATAEQLRRAAGAGTAAGLRRALERLAVHGLVRDIRAGERATLYELNRDHVLYPAVQALLLVVADLPDRLAEAVSQWRVTPISAALFGSAARRDGGIDSDVDLLVVRPDHVAGPDTNAWAEQLHQLRAQVQAWTGNHLQIVDRDVKALSTLAVEREPIVADWRRDAITVYGRDVRELLAESE